MFKTGSSNNTIFKRSRRLLGAAAATLLLATGAYAQDPHFDSGSDGSDGALDVMNGETYVINMDDHPDGIFNFTSVNVVSGGVVEVQANENNTPLVILVQEDFYLDGRLDLIGEDATGAMPGLAGPGGWSGGTAGRNDGSVFEPGAGLGPGGGAPAFGDSEMRTGRGLNDFMKPSLFPQIGGSGGGGGEGPTGVGGGGGGGGGAVTIAVSGLFELGGNGTIDVSGGRGGNSSGNDNLAGSGGSGGSVRIIATSVEGGWTIDARGGSWGSFGPNIGDRTGDAGIIRIETFQRLGGFSNLYGRVYHSLPGLISVDGTGLGTIRISQVGGVDVPADAGSNPALPDVVIPAGVTNPVTVQVTAENVTTGQNALIRLNYEGEGGRVIEAMTGPLTGTEATSTASASIEMDAGNGTMVAVLTTPMSTRGSGAFAGLGSDSGIKIDDEQVVRIEKARALGSDKTQVTYVTESGKKKTFEVDE